VAGLSGVDLRGISRFARRPQEEKAAARSGERDAGLKKRSISDFKAPHVSHETLLEFRCAFNQAILLGCRRKKAGFWGANFGIVWWCVSAQNESGLMSRVRWGFTAVTAD